MEYAWLVIDGGRSVAPAYVNYRRGSCNKVPCEAMRHIWRCPLHGVNDSLWWNRVLINCSSLFFTRVIWLTLNLLYHGYGRRKFGKLYLCLDEWEGACHDAVNILVQVRPRYTRERYNPIHSQTCKPSRRHVLDSQPGICRRPCLFYRKLILNFAPCINKFVHNSIGPCPSWYARP